MSLAPRHASRLFASLAGGFFVVLAVWSAARMSLTNDEQDHIAFGWRVLQGKCATASLQKMAVTALNAAPLLAADRLGIRLSPRVALFVARCPTILAALLLAFLVRFVAARRYGRLAGDCALFLAVFCPTILGHGSLATNDLFASGCPPSSAGRGRRRRGHRRSVSRSPSRAPSASSRRFFSRSMPPTPSGGPSWRSGSTGGSPPPSATSRSTACWRGPPGACRSLSPGPSPRASPWAPW
jgi:hypothetical protein